MDLEPTPELLLLIQEKLRGDISKIDADIDRLVKERLVLSKKLAASLGRKVKGPGVFPGGSYGEWLMGFLLEHHPRMLTTKEIRQAEPEAIRLRCGIWTLRKLLVPSAGHCISRLRPGASKWKVYGLSEAAYEWLMWGIPPNA